MLFWSQIMETIVKMCFGHIEHVDMIIGQKLVNFVYI
jgi:hypothetical protein